MILFAFLNCILTVYFILFALVSLVVVIFTGEQFVDYDHGQPRRISPNQLDKTI
jgi:hypothetical protein